MRFEEIQKKAGVSLVTVLMFMLVATIAATATYKWLTSEGRSSSSRLQKKEAMAYAAAGIDNARTWMTFHANDVGDLIRQYKNKPIEITARLRPLQEAGQNYRVWLTGVNTHNSTYKLKILSTGESSNDTKHTEAAIFNVDGLYRVSIPVKSANAPFDEAFHGDLKSFDVLNVDRAVITQTPEVKNAGGQAANSVTVTDYLVMDGSFYANDATDIKDLYVTGGVGSCSGINVKNNLYVGGVFYTGNVKSVIKGSLYTEGGINLKNTYPYTALTGGCGSNTVGSADIFGNITSNGPFIYYDANGSNEFKGMGSMVLNSKIVFPTTYYKAAVVDKVRIEHNVYVKESSEGKMKDDKSVNCGMVPWQYALNDPSDAIKRTKFGSENDDKIWLKDFSHYKENAPGGPEGYDPCSEYYDIPWNYKCKKEGFTCAKTPVLSYAPYYSAPTSSNIWIGYKGEFLANEPSEEDMVSWNADKMTKYEEKLKDRDSNCDNRIKTPIQFNDDIFNEGLTHTSSARMECSEKIWRQWENSTALMNGCYQKAKERGELYDGKWLIMEFDGPVQWSSGNMNMKDGHGQDVLLVGDFIIRINASTVTNQLPLPPTGENSMVMLYLPDGWPGAANENIEFANKKALNRYFIYSKGDIGRIDMIGIDPPMSGSLVMANCSQANTQGNNTLFARYDQNLTNELFGSSVICSNDGSNTCDPPGADPALGDENEENGGGRLDDYYISMAPQLGVTLETRYESSETISSAEGATTTLSPGFLILPRIIYLPEDPYGKLKDYYNLVPLNGAATNANLKKENLDVNCISGGNSLKTGYNDLLYEDGHTLAKGIYTCYATSDDYGKVRFWVKVGDAERGQPGVSFVSESHKIGKSASNVEIEVDVPPHESAITLRVYCPDVPDSEHWSYSLNNGNRNDETKECTFEIGANTSGHENVTLFSVSTTDAQNGTLVFRLLDDTNTPAKYKLKSPEYTEVHVSSTVTLTRDEVTDDDLEAFCENGGSECPAKYKEYWPTLGCDNESETGVWVVPSTGLSGTTIPNKEWAIVVGGTEEIRLTDVNENNNCQVIIANESRSTADATEGGLLDPLRASIKAKKKTLRVGFTGDVGTGMHPAIKVIAPDRTTQELETCYYDTPDGTDGNTKYCEYDVFAGEKVTFELLDSDDDNFNYWKCAGSTCPTGTEPVPDPAIENLRVSSNYDYYYLAHFGESDKHCFFDEFKDGDASGYHRANRLSLECSAGKEYCINDCDGVCLSATNGSYKWNLLSGSMGNNGDLVYNSDYGYLSIKSSVNKGKVDSERRGVVVMSTVNAGVNGIMKALVQVPKASSHGKDSKNIRNSGIILRSNADATQYLMLNVYVNGDGHLEAQVCRNSDTDCISHELKKDGSSALASVSSMVMVSAELRDNDLTVSAVKDNYYGTPDEYTHTFDVSSLSYRDREHEYVGFSIADQNFKIHGIGWKSHDYNAECWDTYPSVKCSFAAVAKGGIIETNENVEPWIGYSGWFRKTSCEKKYYYYNGSDACGNPGLGQGKECSDGYYKFSSGSGNEGAHGYKDANGYDVKTAKAWLQCNSSGSVDEDWWRNAPESEYAHCGYFWTGEYKECANNKDLVTDRSIDPGENYITFEKANLRKATLIISISGENTEGLEIWLESKNEDGWGMGEPFQSQSFTVKGSGGSYSVADDIAGDSLGFNPEKVTGMKIKNYGTSSVTMTAKSMCDNSVKIQGCSATYNNGQWDISVILDSHGDVQKTEYKAKVNDAAQFGFDDFGGSSNCSKSGNIVTCHQDDEPKMSNQGQRYVFWAKITGKEGLEELPEDEKECEETQTIGTVSLKTCGIGSKKAYPGKGYPQFQVEFEGCPSSGCKYKILLNGEDITSALLLSGNTSNDGSRIFKTAPGNDEDAPATIGNSYTYTIVNDGGPSFKFEGDDCRQEFKIEEEPAAEVEASCGSIDKLAGTLSTSESRTIPADKVIVSNCGVGECTYTIARSASTGSSATYVSGADYEFSDFVSEAGTYKYTFTVTRQKDGSSASCPNLFEVQYPLGGSCPADKTDEEQDPAGVSIEPNITGCGSSCSYTITGGAITDCNGACTGYDGDDPISFTHAGATDTKHYILTVSHDGAESKACEFNVKYPTATPPSSGCKCADYCGSGCENNITTGTVYHNSDGWSGCVFLTSASRINNNNGYTINGTPITENGNLCYGDEAACASKLAAYEPVDGGWYFKIDNIYTDIISSGYNPCAEVSPASISACSVAQTTVAPNADVTVAMTTTNCNVLGGCDYKISADGLTDKTGNFYSGNITFSGESSGSHTYSLYIKNSANATWVKCPSTFAVTYSSDAYINAVLGTQYYGPKKLQYSTSGTCGIDASANTWNTWVTGTVSGYWGGTNGQINGAIKVDVPSGEWFKVNNCW